MEYHAAIQKTRPTVLNRREAEWEIISKHGGAQLCAVATTSDDLGSCISERTQKMLMGPWGLELGVMKGRMS